MDGYQHALATALDESFPVVAALREGTLPEQAGALALDLGKRPCARSATVVGADTLKRLLPDKQGWAGDLRSADLTLLPPSIQVVVEGGVSDPPARAKIAAALEASETGRIVWPTGLT